MRTVILALALLNLVPVHAAPKAPPKKVAVKKVVTIPKIVLLSADKAYTGGANIDSQKLLELAQEKTAYEVYRLAKEDAERVIAECRAAGAVKPRFVLEHLDILADWGRTLPME